MPRGRPVGSKNPPVEPADDSYVVIARECGFNSPSTAKRFCEQTLHKVRRELQARGINDARMPQRQNIWDDIENG